MAGLFGRLFGGKNADQEPKPKKQSASAQKQKQKKEAYFLDTDIARSLGNMDYLKKEKADLEQLANATKPLSEQKTKQPPQEKRETPRRKADSSMDVFRSMAREIKNKKQ